MKTEQEDCGCTCKHKLKFCYIYVCLLVLFAVQLIVCVCLTQYFPSADDYRYSLRRTRRNGAVIENTVTNAADFAVEFFNPKARSDLEDLKSFNSSLGKRTETSNNGSTGTSESGESTQNPWLYLTSQSRIPIAAMQSFCSASKTYCGPGSPGLRGDNGLKGERGERGFPGPRGPIGPLGETGVRGPRGDRGAPGMSGLDGRDGVPGEPGLDGRPGRNGLDGIPGNNGLPGENGIPGMPGTNGTDGKDGRPGIMGPQGTPGSRGPQGIPGVKGRQGKAGSNGINGTPGVCVYQVKLRDGTTSSEFLIPPSIVGADSAFMNKSITVKEDDNIHWKCATAGNPPPTVAWFKVNDTILLRKFKVESVSGPTLNITHINRSHMGTYMCIADNGIPPSANRTIILDVQFSPLIRIYNQSVIVVNSSTAHLECEVEASPKAIKYWKKGNERILEMSDKYRIGVAETSLKYKTRMQLNITKINSSDIGEYQCIAKNDLGKTAGLFSLHYKGSESTIHSVWQEVAVFGKGPPTKESDNELCPPPTECYKCPDTKSLKCEPGGISSLFDLIGHRNPNEIAKPLLSNLSNKDLRRSLACQVYAIGKPVYHRYSNDTYGCWMRDAYNSGEGADEKIWVTRENIFNQLYEFYNKTSFKEDRPSSTYNLDIPFTGNAQVIFNNSFYYNQKDKPNIVRYDLVTNKNDKIQAPFLELTSSNLLYTSMHNYMDFSVDDNGLWVIYGVVDNNTAVLKLDPFTLQIQLAWNITLKQQKAGDMFIVCGVLYAVDSVTDKTTNIRFAFDLYEGKLLEDVNVQFTNPFRRTTMIGYNHRNKELFTWDRGNQLTYPIRYHENGNNLSKDDKEVDGNSKTDAQGFPVTEE